MKTEKWVQCTPELAENPHKVKAWREEGYKNELRFFAYNKKDISSIIFRHEDGCLDEYEIISIQCLIEVSIQERFITFYDGEKILGSSHFSLKEAKDTMAIKCTHILKLTFDGQGFQVETVWTKESNS